MKVVEGNFYIVVKKKKGWNAPLAARLTNKVPALAASEVAIKLKVSIPDALFNRPQLQAKIVIPEDAISKPMIDAVVLDNVKELIEQQMGLDISLSVVESAA